MGSGFQDMLERILPPKAVNGRVFKPKVTTDGVRQDFNAPRKGRNHGGVDINYHYESGASLGQNGINKEHPDVGSPVSGTVEKIDRTGLGKIVIVDSHGYRHTLMHLNKIEDNLSVGMHIEAGQVIGAMGGKGPKGSNEYAQHVHYSVTAPDGTKVNPEAHWNNTPEGKNSSSSFPWKRKINFKPASVLDNATQQRLKSLPQGITIAAGETLRREGDKVWRIERDGSARGYFISP